MSEHCAELHKMFDGMKRYNFPFDVNEIPTNGIYVLFEKDERAHVGDRIVRIGTHTGDNQLRSRLKQHFLNENKDRSIFRKNVGRCLLNKRRDDYLEMWEKDLTSRKNKEKYGALIDRRFQTEMEKEISEIIQSNFSFAVFEVKEKEDRIYYESRLVSEVSNCSICKPSETWLGMHSPKKKIIESGLWQVQQLYKIGFTDDELTDFIKRFG